MSAIINGSSPSVTFSDGTTQATSAIVSGYVPYANLPAGSVLQVVQGQYANNITTTSTSLATTNVTASITPKFSTSKILILVSMNGLYSASSPNAFRFELYKNGGSISYLDDIMMNGIGGANAASSYQYFDSPATTSSTAYAIYWRSNNGSQIGLNNYITGNNRTVSSITLLEIAQ